MHGKGIASNAKYHYVLYERMASDRESIQNGIEKNLFGCCVQANSIASMLEENESILIKFK